MAFGISNVPFHQKVASSLRQVCGHLRQVHQGLLFGRPSVSGSNDGPSLFTIAVCIIEVI